MRSVEAAKEIRKKLKELKISPKQVSVRSDSISVNVSIKDLSINLDKIKSIAKCYEHIDRCEISGETLLGGNLYISVDYDWRVESEARKSEEYNAILNLVKSKVEDIKDNVGVKVVDGFLLFKNCNGSYQADVAWSDEYWNHFYNADSIARELYLAKLQNLTNFSL